MGQKLDYLECVDNLATVI